MRVALVLDPVTDLELARAQALFHAASGVAVVLVAEQHARAASDLPGATTVSVPVPPAARVEDRREAFQHAAVAAGADWVLEARPGVFWWPRSGDLAETLAATPSRYTVVRSIDRPLLVDAVAGSAAASRATLRQRSIGAPSVEEDEGIAVRPGSGRVMAMRGWRPLERLLVPVGDPASSPLTADRIAEGLADGTLVRDTRLRDALDLLAGGTVLPEATIRLEEGRLRFARPSLADDAAYADEMAARRAIRPHRGAAPARRRRTADLAPRAAPLEEARTPRVAETARVDLGRGPLRERLGHRSVPRRGQSTGRLRASRSATETPCSSTSARCTRGTAPTSGAPCAAGSRRRATRSAEAVLLPAQEEGEAPLVPGALASEVNAAAGARSRKQASAMPSCTAWGTVSGWTARAAVPLAWVTRLRCRLR